MMMRMCDEVCNEEDDWRVLEKDGTVTVLH